MTFRFSLIYPSVLFLTPLLVMLTTPSLASTERLECRLLIHITASDDTYTNEKGRTIKLSKRNGVANCVDGRLIQIQMMLSELDIEQKTLFNGYAVYTFENADTLTIQVRGVETDGQSVADYTLITGTGEFENARGEGVVRSVNSPHKYTLQYDLALNVEKQ